MMKKRTAAFLTAFGFVALMISSCSGLKQSLSEQAIAEGLKQALIQGVNRGGTSAGTPGFFGGNDILKTILPENAVKVLNTLETLGLASEVTRFTNTLSSAASKSAQNAVPVFISGIRNMSIRDAVGILGGGYDAATRYLKSNINDSLVQAIRPEVASALSEYKVQQSFEKLLSNTPVKKLNIDLNTVVAQLVANQMFKEVEQEEYRIRTQVEARKTLLLQQVFGSAKAYRP